MNKVLSVCGANGKSADLNVLIKSINERLREVEELICYAQFEGASEGEIEELVRNRNGLAEERDDLQRQLLDPNGG